MTKETSAAFTGHRFMPYEERKAIKQRVRNAVEELYEKGVRTFYCGMAMGFDLLAGEVVLYMKAKHPDLQLVAVVPFKGQESRFRSFEKEMYAKIIEGASEVVVLNEEYVDGCFLRRNDYMLSKSSHIIAYYDGKQKGGTFYTVRRAEKAGMGIYNTF